MGLLGKFKVKKQIAERQQQMEAFVKTIRERNDVDLGYTLLLATYVRHKVKEDGYDLLLTNMKYELNQQACAKLGQMIQEFKHNQQPPMMYACMIWVYTMNAATSMDLRSQGRQMWCELRRGAPHVKENLARATKLLGEEPDYTGFDNWPHGF